MRLYLLTRIGRVGYDQYDAKLIRAENPEAARAAANEKVGDEGKIWGNPENAHCQRVVEEGPSGTIIESFCAG